MCIFIRIQFTKKYFLSHGVRICSQYNNNVAYSIYNWKYLDFFTIEIFKKKYIYY